MVSRIVAAARAACTPVKGVEIPDAVWRIGHIPYSLLPDANPARDALITLAWRHVNVNAYQAAGTGEWVIWCPPNPNATDQSGRYSIEEWKAVCDRDFARLLPNLWKEEA